MTDHKASEPTPRTEASEQTPRTDAVLLRGKGVSASILIELLKQHSKSMERELQSLTRKLAEAEEKRLEDVRRCEFVCNIQRDYDLDRTGKSWYEGILDACEAIRDTFPEAFK